MIIYEKYQIHIWWGIYLLMMAWLADFNLYSWWLLGERKDNLLFHYQTLIAAFLASAAAIYAARRTIKKMQEQIDESRRANFIVALTKLPHAIVELSRLLETILQHKMNLCEKSSHYANDYWTFDVNAKLAASIPELITPLSAIEILGACAANADSKTKLGQYILEISNDLQVDLSRFYSFKQDLSGKPDCKIEEGHSITVGVGGILHTINLQCKLYNILGYARSGTLSTEVSKDNILSAASSMGLYKGNIYNAVIKSRYIEFLYGEKSKTPA